MTEIKISYEHERFKLKTEKEGGFFILETLWDILPVDIKSLGEELKNKKFNAYFNDGLTKNKDIIKKNINLEQVHKERLNSYDKGLTFNELEVINPNNVVKIDLSEGKIYANKTIVPFKNDLIELFCKSFDYAKNYEGYKSFIKFFKEGLAKEFKITEDEEFPGTMLRFYKNNEFIKAIYIYEEKIKFVESFANEYKKMKFEKIKEDIEEINEQLKLEGKENLKLDFK